MLDTRKLLITRNAGLAETIKGLNEGRLNYYLPKPWESEQLTNAVKEQLTEFFIRIRKNPMAFIDKLNSMRILEAIHKGLIPIEST
jgi:two-component system, OmpR family, phosphate regulon response regulator PhoB